MESLLQDLRFTARMMRHNPGVTAVVVLTLALGIGANIAIFSIVYTVLLRPLPYREPERLVQVWGQMPSRNVPFHFVPYPDFAEWRRQARSFEAMSAFRPDFRNMIRNGEPRRMSCLLVNAGFFGMIGLPLPLGRGFLPEEDRPGGGDVVVVAHAMWQQDFGADPDIVGRALILDGRSHTVVGVAPPALQLRGDSVDLYLPLAATDVPVPQTPAVSVGAYARLHAGVTIEGAQREIDSACRRLDELYPVNIPRSARIWGLREFMVRDVRSSLWIVMGLATLVLLIACANVASILLARSAARRPEMAVRSALGAGRGRVMSQMLTESVLQSLAGGLVGALCAFWGVAALAGTYSDNFPLLRSLSMDGSILGFTVGTSLLTGLLSGVIPALTTGKGGASRILRGSCKEGIRGASEGRGARRIREVLVVSEVALSLLLLITAAQLARSFLLLQAVEPGFEPEGVLTGGIALPLDRYPDAAKRREFYREFLERLEQVGEIQAAGIVDFLPLSGSNAGSSLYLEGHPPPRPGEAPIVWLRMTSSGYFSAMSIPILSGRLFSAGDTAEAPRVAIVNRAFARRFWPGENPVGKRFSFSPPGPDASYTSVIGVAGDVRHTSLAQDPDAEVFFSYRQLTPARVTVALRTAADPSRSALILRRAVASVDKDLPVSRIRGMEQIVAGSIAARRLTMTVVVIFGSLALLLAAVGIYGVISYSVARRSREIGIRKALGAQSDTILRSVVGRTLLLAVTGEAAGLGAAFALRRVMETQLYGIASLDPAVFLAVPPALLLMALFAGLIPARRAMQVSPVIALARD